MIQNISVINQTKANRQEILVTLFQFADVSKETQKDNGRSLNPLSREQSANHKRSKTLIVQKIQIHSPQLWIQESVYRLSAQQNCRKITNNRHSSQRTAMYKHIHMMFTKKRACRISIDRYVNNTVSWKMLQLWNQLKTCHMLFVMTAILSEPETMILKTGIKKITENTKKN